MCGDTPDEGWHGEWSDLDMVYCVLRKCVSAPFHMHNCSKMSGIGHTGPLQPLHMVSGLDKLPDILPSTILLR